MLKRTVALFSCLCILTACLSFSSAADGVLPDFSITQGDWNARWDETGNLNTNVCLTPGSDETKLNFSWHCGLDYSVPYVKLSKSSDMSDPAIFTGSSSPADEGYKTCRVTATGIDANAVYYYIYGMGSLVFGPYIYRTLKTDSFKFLYLNDLHAGFDENNSTVGRDKAYKIHSTVNTALTADPDIGFIVSGGDNTDSGQLVEEWNGLLTSPIFRSLPIAFAIGNHDKKGVSQKYYVNNPNEYDAELPSPVGRDYWFRYGNALFLFFDSTNGNATDHLNFAMEAVNKNLDAKWRIGILHNDMNSPSFGFLTLDNNLIRIVYTTIVDRAGLDIVLNGHSHIYGRSHFLKGGKITGLAFGKTITNPIGTTFISMSAVNNVSSDTQMWQNIWTAKRCRDDITTYSTFELNGDSLKFKAFYATGDQCDEYTIIKTENVSKPFEEPGGIDLYSIVKLAGFIYTLIDSLNK